MLLMTGVKKWVELQTVQHIKIWRDNTGPSILQKKMWLEIIIIF